MYNASSNNWTRIPDGLGQARCDLAAASLPSGLVIFAGGTSGLSNSACCLLPQSVVLRCRAVTMTIVTACLRIYELMVLCAFFHIGADVSASGLQSSAYVDIYNATSNSWSRFPTGLGQARNRLAAASLPSGLVFFAGGQTGVDSGSHSAYVDMYNASSNNWTRIPGGLGKSRRDLAAASLPSGLVIFAGGTSGLSNSARCLKLLGFYF